jgi:PIN domain nuclease of toxin-antitoxin system
MSGLLLDTHILLWYFQDHPNLKRETIEQLENPANALYISLISLWEIAIKINIGKLNLGCSFPELFSLLERFEIEILPLTVPDIEFYITLPLHHRDPFDRILIAQGMNRSLTLISYDNIFNVYSLDKSSS